MTTLVRRQRHASAPEMAGALATHDNASRRLRRIINDGQDGGV